MTDSQRESLTALCERYNVEFREDDYRPQFDLPTGWVGGWVGGPKHGMIRTTDEYGDEWRRTRDTTIYVGCDPEGHISS